MAHCKHVATELYVRLFLTGELIYLDSSLKIVIEISEGTAETQRDPRRFIGLQI